MSKADTPLRDQAVNRLSNEQLSCSELTGFRVCSEHCCSDLERPRPASGSCPGGAEVVRRIASHELRGSHDQGQIYNQSCCALNSAKDRQAQIPRAVHAC